MRLAIYRDQHLKNALRKSLLGLLRSSHLQKKVKGSRTHRGSMSTARKGNLDSGNVLEVKDMSSRGMIKEVIFDELFLERTV